MEKEDIILLSTADWDNPFWTNKQHVAMQLAKRGHRVFYIDSLGLRNPTSRRQDLVRIFQRIGKFFRIPYQSRQNIWIWSPIVLPFQKVVFFRTINKILFNGGLFFWLKCLGIRKHLLWTYNPLTTLFVDLNRFQKVVYHCVDEIKTQPGMPVSLLEKSEKDLALNADLVFVVSPKLLETRKEWNPNTYYLPNVADFEHFSKALAPATEIPSDIEKIPTPRIGFIGAVSNYKIDFELIRFIAQNRPDWSLILIGKVGEGDPWTDISPLSDLPNLYLLGPRPYPELPNYLKAFDAAILPNRLNTYTESMFPMKFFEYLAAGKIIVSVDLDCLREFRDVALIAKTPREFIQQIDDAIHGLGPPLNKRLELARLYTYENRMEKMMQLLNSINE